MLINLNLNLNLNLYLGSAEDNPFRLCYIEVCIVVALESSAGSSPNFPTSVSSSSGSTFIDYSGVKLQIGSKNGYR